MLQRSYYYGLSPKEVPRQRPETKVANVGRPGRGQGKGEPCSRPHVPSQIDGRQIDGKSIRISALGPWRHLARTFEWASLPPPCLPAHSRVFLAQFLLVCRSRGQATLDGKTHDNIVQLPAYHQPTHSLTHSLTSTARAEQGRGGLDQDLDQELDWKEHHIAPPHITNITIAPTVVSCSKSCQAQRSPGPIPFPISCSPCKTLIIFDLTPTVRLRCLWGRVGGRCRRQES